MSSQDNDAMSSRKPRMITDLEICEQTAKYVKGDGPKKRAAREGAREAFLAKLDVMSRCDPAALCVAEYLAWTYLVHTWDEDLPVHQTPPGEELSQQAFHRLREGVSSWRVPGPDIPEDLEAARWRTSYAIAELKSALDALEHFFQGTWKTSGRSALDGRATWDDTLAMFGYTPIERARLAIKHGVIDPGVDEDQTAESYTSWSRKRRRRDK